MITLKEATYELQARRPFNAGNLTGLMSETYFCVFSYSQVIARTNLETGETWINPSRYSQTTSKHANLVKKAWGLN